MLNIFPSLRHILYNNNIYIVYENDITIRLLALDFYEVIVDEGGAQTNYHLIEIESE